MNLDAQERVADEKANQRKLYIQPGADDRETPCDEIHQPHAEHKGHQHHGTGDCVQEASLHCVDGFGHGDVAVVSGFTVIDEEAHYIE